MKYLLHVPVEQFGFISAEMDTEAPHEACEAYRALQREWEGVAGLPDKEWNVVLDAYRSGKGLSVEDGEMLSERQKWMIHELDKGDLRDKRRKIIEEAKTNTL